MPSLKEFKRLSPHVDAALSHYELGGLPHALLIHGPVGVGKKTLARLLCMLVLCRNDREKPCGVCDSCQRVLRGTHSNVLVFSAGEQPSIKIDDMRAVLSALGQHGLQEGSRVVVIEEAERMTPQAQNALLKSLEEPDSRTYFLLTAASEKGLMPTILSRTSRLFLPLWDEQALSALLELSGMPPEQAQELAKVSAGSPGLALRAGQDSELEGVLSVLANTFFSVCAPGDIPAASNALKGEKDNADLLLDMLENRLSNALLSCRDDAERTGTANMLAAVGDARRYRAANVSWQAIADLLLFHALEDLHSCQWS